MSVEVEADRMNAPALRSASDSDANVGGIVFGRREIILLLINLGFMLGMTLSPYFLTIPNFRVMIVGMAMETVVLAAMVILLVGGMFDLSVDGVVHVGCGGGRAACAITAHSPGN